jgi:hypothetical protein
MSLRRSKKPLEWSEPTARWHTPAAANARAQTAPAPAMLFPGLQGMTGAGAAAWNGAHEAQAVRPTMMPPVLDTPRAHAPARPEELGNPRSDDTIERLTYRFFAEPPESAHDDGWFYAAAPPLPKDMRRAMIATIAMLVLSTLSIGSFVIYHRVIMPFPVELGRGHALAMPRPETEPPPVIAPPAQPALATQPQKETIASLAKPSSEPAQPGRAAKPSSAPAQPAHAAKPSTAPAQPGRAVKQNTAPAQPGRAAKPEAFLMLAEGDALHRRGDVAAALAIYERASALWPDFSMPLVRLAAIHLHRGDARRAHAFAERAIHVDGRVGEAWAVLAGARKALGDQIGARAAYQVCVSKPVEHGRAIDCGRFMR